MTAADLAAADVVLTTYDVLRADVTLNPDAEVVTGPTVSLRRRKKYEASTGGPSARRPPPPPATVCEPNCLAPPSLPLWQH